MGAKIASEESPTAAIRGAVDTVGINSIGQRRRALSEGDTHADQCAAGNFMAGDEDCLPAAGPEGHDGAMGVVEAPKHR